MPGIIQPTSFGKKCHCTIITRMAPIPASYSGSVFHDLSAQLFPSQTITHLPPIRCYNVLQLYTNSADEKFSHLATQNHLQQLITIG